MPIDAASAVVPLVPAVVPLVTEPSAPDTAAAAPADKAVIKIEIRGAVVPVMPDCGPDCGPDRAAALAVGLRGVLRPSRIRPSGS